MASAFPGRRAGLGWGAERTPRVARSPARPVHGVSGATGGAARGHRGRVLLTTLSEWSVRVPRDRKRRERSPGCALGPGGPPRPGRTPGQASIRSVGRHRGPRPGHVASRDPRCLPGPGGGWGRSVLIPAGKRDSGVSAGGRGRGGGSHAGRRRTPSPSPRPPTAAPAVRRLRSAPVPAGRNPNPNRNPNPSRAKAGDGVSACEAPRFSSFLKMDSSRAKCPRAGVLTPRRGPHPSGAGASEAKKLGVEGEFK